MPKNICYTTRDDTHMTSMKIGQFAGPLPTCPSMSKIPQPP